MNGRTGGEQVIALIDYGMGNLGSVHKALEAVGGEVKIATSPAEVGSCGAVLLPGVGNFGDGMHNLNERNWSSFLREYTASGKPFLGICLGMQMLFDSSEEAPGVPGLGIVPGRVIRFDANVGKVPHMGWNSVRVKNPAPEMLSAVAGKPEFFYFVHSYYVCPDDASWSCGETDYNGVKFTSAVGRGKLLATQFHPEKSQQAGLAILKRFAALAAAR